MAAEGCDQPPHTAFADISEARPLSFLGLARTGTGLACQFSYRPAARIAASLLCASARVRTRAAVRFAIALGVGATTDGAAGHLIKMKAGRSAGRCSSTSS